jgi:hypothetical protein
MKRASTEKKTSAEKAIREIRHRDFDVSLPAEATRLSEANTSR